MRYSHFSRNVSSQDISGLRRFFVPRLTPIFSNGVATLVFIFSISLDIKNQRRERAVGKKVLWYKRPALYGNGGGLCFILSESLDVLVTNNTLPRTLFFYILIAILIICGICSAIYGLKLARHQQEAQRLQ